MAKRVVTKVGDVFCVKVDDNHKKYFQYIINDLTQLNSDVIRVFKENYPIDALPELEEIVHAEIDFYSHCVISVGVKRGLWEKIGNIKEAGDTENIIFKDKLDYTRIDIQNDWRIWHINRDIICVENLNFKDKQTHLGLVFQPEQIVHKTRTGSYYGVFANYE
ncbi:MAG: hypothetical protein J5510_01915 [Prevotella sp.]|nr:hypothetical protein [Prevotella sp.]